MYFPTRALLPSASVPHGGRAAPPYPMKQTHHIHPQAPKPQVQNSEWEGVFSHNWSIYVSSWLRKMPKSLKDLYSLGISLILCHFISDRFHTLKGHAFCCTMDPQDPKRVFFTMISGREPMDWNGRSTSSRLVGFDVFSSTCSQALKWRHDHDDLIRTTLSIHLQ